MKLDTGKAWSDAVSLITQNRDVVLTVAGLFFFLPGFAFVLLLPEAVSPQQASAPAGADFNATIEAMQAQIMEQIENYWWVTLLLTVLQWFGMLALMALLIDRDRPTVGEAMGIGGRGLVPYVLAQLLVVLGLSIAIGLPLGILSAIGGGLGAVLLMFIVVPFAIYVFVKVTLLPAVIALEQTTNPIAALKRSWKLTKGNTFSLGLFLVLLTFAAMIVALLVSLVLNAVFAAFGDPVAQIGAGFVESAVSAVVAVILLAAIAAVYRQLAGPDGADISETFE